MSRRKSTVKARERHGTKSLDLTLPAAICREYGILAGDVFEISVSPEKDSLTILYRRVYSQAESDHESPGTS